MAPCIDDRADIACFAVFARRKNCSLGPTTESGKQGIKVNFKFSLKKKSYLVFSMILLVVLIGGAVSLFTYQRISQQYENMDNDIVPGAMIMLSLKSKLMELAGDLHQFVTTKSMASEEEIIRVCSEVRELVNRHYEHEQHIGKDEQASALLIKQKGDEAIRTTEQILETVRTSQSPDQVTRLQKQMYEMNEETERILDGHVKTHKTEMAQAGSKLRASLKVGYWSLFLSALFTVFIVLGISVFTSRTILAPLSVLQTGAARIGEGELGYKVNISTGDELETLARQFNQMSAELSASRTSLERKVTDRTSELREANKAMEGEIARRQRTEESLHMAKLEAEEANRLKSVFLANMSHEIRTPLNAIIGFAENNTVNDSLQSTQKQSKIILEQAENLLALINDLLDNAKIEAGKLELEMHPFDLRQMLQRVVSSTNIQAHAKGLVFSLDIDDRAPQYIVGDALRIHQVLMNFLVNAIKFTEKGSITLKVETLKAAVDNCQLRFAVIDTGIGIAKDKQKTIFESFAQADSSTTRKYGGTGLGTTISRQLLELMGSRISLESEQGKGSTFSFTLDLQIATALPESESRNQGEERHDRRAYPRRKGNILVAEDYRPNQEVISMHLQGAGHTVTIVDDGKKAVAAAAAQLFDLILMDIQMPEMDGYDATRAIRSSDSRCANAPILALTANGDSETAKTCRQAGMDDIMTKPIRRKPLLAALNEWLSQNRPPETSDDNPSLEHTDEKPFDFQLAVEEFDGHADVVTRLMGIFLKEAEIQIRHIVDALDTQDTETIRREAHKIRGAAGNIEATPLSLAAEDLEELVKSGQLDNAAEKVKALKQEFTRLKEYV